MLEVHLKCLATINNIEFLDDICTKVLKKSGFKDCRKLSFAMHEIIINSVDAVIQKFGENNLEMISIDIKANEDKAEIIIKDTAGGISEKDWESINEKDFNDVLMNDRGRGFLFIKQFVDSFEHYMDANNKSTFKLTKGSESNE